MGRAPWAALLVLSLTVLLLPFGNADAAGLLYPDTFDAKPGDTLLLTADFCATGATLTTLDVTVATGSPSGPATTSPLDALSVGLTQTADGFTFTYTVTEARSYVWFSAACDDATSGSSEQTPVTVWPPLGQFWWDEPSGGFGGMQGTSAFVSAASIDCVEGSVTTAQVFDGTTVLAAATGPVSGATLQFAIDIPQVTPVGEFEVWVTCDAVQGGQIIDVRPFTVTADPNPPTAPPDTPPDTGTGAGGGNIPVTGNSMSIVPATVVLLAGIALTLLSRRPAAD